MFNFTEGDIVTSIAQEQKILQRCHALVWHSQLAPWVEETEWTAEELEAVVVEHVTKVMEHYRGQCYAWDVVNEALEEDGSYRESVFYQVLGEDYIKLAFRTAAAVEPGVKLYYNDYNLEKPSPKADGAIRIVKMLQAAGIKIDGVGLQAHHTAHRAPSFDEQRAVLASYAALGVETAYTELDVRVELPVNATNMAWQADAYKNVSFPVPAPPAFHPKHSTRKSRLLTRPSAVQATKACVQDESCVGMTIWDFYDPFSWVPPVFPGNGAALLWFDDFEKHPAYYSIIEAFREKTGAKPPCKPKKRSFTERRSSQLY